MKLNPLSKAVYGQEFTMPKLSISEMYCASLIDVVWSKYVFGAHFMRSLPKLVTSQEGKADRTGIIHTEQQKKS